MTITSEELTAALTQAEPVGTAFVEAGEYDSQENRFEDERFADIYDIDGTEVVDLEDEKRDEVYLEHGNPTGEGGFEVEGSAQVHRVGERSVAILNSATQ